MRPLKILINQQNLPLAFEGFLFNESKQVLKQKESGYDTFFLVNDTSIIARFHLFIQDGKGFSPYRAPFGSIEFDDTVIQEELNYFVEKILEFCTAQKITYLQIVSYPNCYAPRQSNMLERVFLTYGFLIKYTDLNYHIPVKTTFEEHLHLSKKRRLKKCLKEDFTFKRSKGEYVKEIYELVKQSRERKGFPISMKEEELGALFINNPNDYWSFTLWNQNELVAASIGVRVSSNILYYFLPADNEKYKTFSPSVLIVKHMYDFCIENKMEVLDLGISTSAGVKNEGLIRFKENLGGVLSYKYTFERYLA